MPPEPNLHDDFDDEFDDDADDLWPDDGPDGPLALETPPAQPPPPLTQGQIALRVGAGATGLTFLGASLIGAWPLALGAMAVGGGLIFVWMGHESAAHVRLARRIRQRIGENLATRGFTAIQSDTWRRDDVTLRWQRFTDPHAASRAPAALAGKVELPESLLELTAPLLDLPAASTLAPAEDRTGLDIEWADHLVATGDAAFDARFTLGGPARPLLALLDPELRAQLLALDDEAHPIELSDGTLRMQAPCVDDPGPAVERFDALLHAVQTRLAEPVEDRLRRQLLAARDDEARLHRLLPCIEEVEHPTIVRRVEAEAQRWPWLAVVRASRIGGAALVASLRTALASPSRNPPWGLVEPALTRHLADGPDPALLLSLTALDGDLHQPLVRFLLARRPAGDALLVALLRAPGALFGYLDSGGDAAVLPVLVAGHGAGATDIERALRDVATHQLDQIALPAIVALGEVGDAGTAEWIDAQLADDLRPRVIARQDALNAAARRIRQRVRRVKDALHAELGGGLAVSDAAAADGRLSPAAGGELSEADRG